MMPLSLCVGRTRRSAPGPPVRLARREIKHLTGRCQARRGRRAQAVGPPHTKLSGRATRRRKGFTLLEMLVATLLMGIAVVGLLANLSVSLRNASRLTAYDRAVLLARDKLEELRLEQNLPQHAFLEGAFDPAETGVEAGWRARIVPFEAPPKAGPGTSVLDRIEVEVWWKDGARTRALALEGYRRWRIPIAEAPQ